MAIFKLDPNPANVDSACNFDTSCLRTPEPGHVMSPWVRVTFNKTGRSISVGNLSYFPEQTACIKDFEFGHEKGLSCRLTIHDEQGGAFAGFMRDLMKDLKCVKGDAYNMEVQFGWTKSFCGTEISSDPSPPYKMFCRDIDCNFSGGKFMFEVTGVDISEVMFEAKSEKIYGGDGDAAIYLTDAIEEMMKDDKFPPSMSTVKFQKSVPQGCKNDSEAIALVGVANPTVSIPLKFRNSDGANIDPEKGPKGKWECKGRDKIHAAIDWLSPYFTDSDKAIIPYYNSESPAEIIFWEDFKPNCNEVGRDWNATSHGTYVVNGGSYSSVIEFNPKIKWNWSNLTNSGGNMGGQQVMANPNGGKQPGLPECNTINRKAVPSAGSTTTAVADENAEKTFGPKAPAKVMEGQARVLKALKVYHLPIEADLVVVGEPRAMRPINGLFKNIHIVFVNPYFITGGTTDETTNQVSCGEWLASPLCNEVLSNKAWLVNSITHRITDGKFSTTFGVYLTTPGVDIDVGDPLGGKNSGGWVPPPNC